MNNPFSLVFRKEPQLIINTFEQFDMVKDSFLNRIQYQTLI